MHWNYICRPRRFMRPEWILVLVACSAVSGCAERVVDVSGTISMDGVPVEHGVVIFRPDDGKGPTAEAAINDGAYSLRMSPGTKRVLIQGNKITGEAYPWGKDKPPAPVLEPVVPESYYSDSEIVAEIDDDHEALDFALPVTD